MSRNPWQLNPVEGRTSRDFKKSEKGGRTSELISHRRGYTRHRHGNWFAHGLPIYQLWWEFLVRAYQADGIVVDRGRYKDWGSADDYLNIDIWSAKSRKEGFWTFWKTCGIDLFAEHDDRDIRILSQGETVTVDENRFCLDIPSGTKPEELMTAIKRLVRENTEFVIKDGKKKKRDKTSHISTAKEQITINEIRPNAYRLLLKMWDMRRVPSPQFNGKYDEVERDGDCFSLEKVDEIHGMGGKEDLYWDEYKMTHRNLWKAKKIIKNVAKGEFPGKIV
jgi:hypothetical protein